MCEKIPPIRHKNKLKAMMMIMKNPPPKIKPGKWSNDVNFQILN